MFLIRRFDPEKHHRRSIRLEGYDYSKPGTYFVTICARDRNDFFGTIRDRKMFLNDYGRLVEQIWHELPNYVPNISMDAFVIMPDHIHGIIIIHEPVPIRSYSKQCPLPEIIRRFKSYSARRINKIRGVINVPVWQRNYYESILRDERHTQNVRKYIFDNPIKIY